MNATAEIPRGYKPRAQSIEWSTPDDVFVQLKVEFGPFDLDPCATAETAKARLFYSIQDNGLMQEWHGLVFMNPPYGRGIGEWVRKAHDASLEGATVVCLLPASTDSWWWHDHVLRAADIRFIRGRLKFKGAQHNAPFPSVIVVFRPAPGVAS